MMTIAERKAGDMADIKNMTAKKASTEWPLVLAILLIALWSMTCAGLEAWESVTVAKIARDCEKP